MRIPDPEPGLVVRYDFLWSRDAERGRTSSKDRPACVVAALDEPGDPRLVVLLAITHAAPADDTIAMEIPIAVCRKLGLDEARSWIVLSEYNIDLWPSPGLASLPGKRKNVAYGFLPPNLFARIKVAFREAHIAGKTRGTRR